MEIKKNRAVNLERRRVIHIQLGLVLALSFVLISLEWTTPEDKVMSDIQYAVSTDIEEDIMKLIPREPIQPPQKKLPKVMVIVDDFQEVDDEALSGLVPEEYDREGIEIDWGNLLDEEVEEVVEPLHGDFVEIQAEFPGGEEALMKFVYSNLVYPEECVEHGIGGRVTAKFIVNKFGKVTNVEIVKGRHPLLDEEVLRVLNLLPDFRPAMQNQQLVPVYMYWPIIFELR
jgi:protein TonB